LADTDILMALLWMKSQVLGVPARWLWLASVALRAPYWWCLEQFSRRGVNRAIYSNYRGLPVAQVRGLAAAYCHHRVKPKLFAQALARLEAFKRQDVRIVLVTGNLDFYTEPLANDLGAHCIAARLEERNGRFTGALTTEPLTGEVKATAVGEYAKARDVDLRSSYALGDAGGDLPMLECVGFPVAVNPDRRLTKVALERGWPIEHWRT
jgi:HAD superfamily hydrolase (TIGR01490 family)